jgi:hypothetical protein
MRSDNEPRRMGFASASSALSWRRGAGVGSFCISLSYGYIFRKIREKSLTFAKSPSADVHPFNLGLIDAPVNKAYLEIESCRNHPCRKANGRGNGTNTGAAMLPFLLLRLYVTLIIRINNNEFSLASNGTSIGSEAVKLVYACNHSKVWAVAYCP